MQPATAAKSSPPLAAPGVFSDAFGGVALLYGRATRPNRFHASVFGFPIETTLGIQLGRLR